MSHKTQDIAQEAREHNDSRVSFEKLPEKQQMMIVYDMLTYLRGSMANIERRNIEFQEDQRAYRRKREQSEDSRSLTTSRKIENILAGKFDSWVYFRDRILPPILIAIVLGILYVVFGK